MKAILIAGMTSALSAMLISAQPAQPEVRLTTSSAANAWLTAAGNHEPGSEDVPLQTIAHWSPDALKESLSAVKKADATDELNELLERAALLHADISLLTRHTGVRPPAEGWDFPGSTIIVSDGEYRGSGGLDPHIQFARLTLRAIRPPRKRNESSGAARERIRQWEEAHRRNPRIQQWFRAVSADFAYWHWLGDLRRHLEDALAMVPDDPRSHYDSGCLAEIIASPQIQQGVPGSQNRRADNTDPLLDERINLAQAEKYYRTSFDRAPMFDEARVRLARILLLRGKPQEAIDLLRAALPNAEPVVRYYRSLVLADALEETGNAQAAHEEYEHALALFPDAQSPLIAMARLARARGDAAVASARLANIAALRGEEHRRLDPWWMYHDCSGRDRDREVAQLYEIFRKARK